MSHKPPAAAHVLLPLHFEGPLIVQTLNARKKQAVFTEIYTLITHLCWAGPLSTTCIFEHQSALWLQ